MKFQSQFLPVDSTSGQLSSKPPFPFAVHLSIICIIITLCCYFWLKLCSAPRSLSFPLFSSVRGLSKHHVYENLSQQRKRFSKWTWQKEGRKNITMSVCEAFTRVFVTVSGNFHVRNSGCKLLCFCSHYKGNAILSG